MSPFATEGRAAEVAVVVVSHNSAEALPPLLDDVATEADRGLRIRVVVVDNASADDSLSVARTHPGVITVAAPGNLGYAGGMNLGLRHVDPAEAVLVLNPDVRLTAGSIEQLLLTLRESGASVAVPRIVDAEGELYPSLRREPTVRTALGDALFGGRWRGRPGWLSETVWDGDAYTTPGDVDWATGAALLIRRDVARSVGPWDERFFLYSEETDLLRRVRVAGGTVRYDPRAVVQHSGQGSGSSPALDALLTVNRVRYMRKHAGKMRAGVFRVAVGLGEFLRAYDAAHRLSFRHVVDEASWASLPQAHRGTAPSATSDARVVDLPAPGQVAGSVVIPAHNEAGVIGTLLRSIQPLTQAGLEIVVAANGCSDDTVATARSFPGVRVLDLATPSKTAALNAGDAVATAWPRLYLDADVSITPRAVLDTLAALGGAEALAARPAYRWDTAGASWPVRRYYAARGRLLRESTSLWGAGAYAVTRRGHERIAPFPPVTADDVHVDLAFVDQEKTVVETTPVVVRAPRTTGALLRVLRRQADGPAELGHRTTGGTARSLVGTVRTPAGAVDALAYATLAASARTPSRPSTAWLRDETTRVPA